MTRFLNVYLGANLVGLLEQDNDGELWFSYSPSWLESPHAVPLSVSLPLRQERFKRKECRPFFAGLLPEETSRKLVAQAFGVSEKNDFAILDKIGAECAGAVSLLQTDETPIIGKAHYREVSESELAEKLAKIAQHPLLAGENRIRLSLAGAQGKIAIMIREGRYFLSLDGSPSTHILKPQSPHFEGLVENEHFCMALAAGTGLDVAKTEIGHIDGQKFLQVARYDRQADSTGIFQRIHQEDFCQALAVPPELKYQQEGGPNLKKCFELIRAQSTAPGPDVLKLFDAVVFNYLIGNSDAHGKNFSLLYGDRGCRLAPLYDLVCTRAYEGLATEMAMKIGGERDPDRVRATHWIKFFDEAGLGRAGAIQRLMQLVGRVKRGIPRSHYQGPVKAIAEKNCATVLALKWASGMG